MARMGYDVLYYQGGPKTTCDPRGPVWALSTNDLTMLMPRLGAVRGVVIAAAPHNRETWQALGEAGWITVYDCIDDWSAFMRSGQMEPRFVIQEPAFCQQADVVVASAPALVERCVGLGARSVECIRNGGPEFAEPRDPAVPDEGEIIRWAFCGSLWGSWLDWGVIKALHDEPGMKGTVVGRLGGTAPPHITQALGVQSLQNVWASYPRIEWTGELPHAEAIRKLATCDVGIMPFRDADISRSVDPCKLYDYWAAGLGVICTPCLTPVVGRPHVVAVPARAFAKGIAISVDQLRQSGRPDANLVRTNSWRARAKAFLAAVDAARVGRNGTSNSIVQEERSGVSGDAKRVFA